MRPDSKSMIHSCRTPVRVDVKKGNAHAGGTLAEDRLRDLAGSLLKLPDVVAVEIPEQAPCEEDVSRLFIRARNPQRFFRALTRLALEEWYEIRHLETIDDSTEAVLGYLLGSGS